MRVPRVKEFDPNAKEPVLKSSFDNLPVIQKQPTSTRPKEELYRRRRETTPDPRPIKKRHPFDIYLDQYKSLREFSITEQKKGHSGSMSAMVRDALDMYITERTKK